MKNQFFYTRKVALPLKEDETEPKYDYFIDSFNINKVIRSVQVEKNKTLVLLDDFHQRKEQVPIYNKQGKHTGFKNELGTYQSEIYLTEEEDIKKFTSYLAIY